MADANQTTKTETYDAVIIGAGVSGMYMLHRLRALGLTARVYEAGSGVGGTWYWNRYPGARFDSESYSYGYSFDQGLLQDWDWQEHFAGQPEILQYLEHVADRFDLRRDISFNTRIASAHFDEQATTWEIVAEDGRRARGRFLITALGPLSAPTMPSIPGMEDFQGDAWHTAHWPHEPVSFDGRRVGVIGTGATGVQAITEIAKTAGTLTVFQRNPNYCAPLGNGPISSAEMDEIRARYPEIFARCRETHGGFLHNADHRLTMDLSPAEREAVWEKLYHERGFGIWTGNFRDTFTDQAANDLLSDFVRGKIRARVQDPAVAELLTPTNHGFGTRRVPLESGYYEVYNQPNVSLVDIRRNPIERITKTGIVVDGQEHALDMIIYATGFDAVTGAFSRMDIRGRAGQSLTDKWADGPRTNLGLTVAGFPNMLTLVGPHNAGTFCNIPRCIEQNVDWVSDLMTHMRDQGLASIETTEAAEDDWTAHVYETAAGSLLSKTDSWFTGVNQNLPDKKRTFYAYAGGAPAYRKQCDEVAADGYRGFVLG